jgi:hypothetical protein
MNYGISRDGFEISVERSVERLFGSTGDPVPQSSRPQLKIRGGGSLNKDDYATLTRAGEPPPPPVTYPGGGGSVVGDKTEDLGRLEAPREDLSPQIGQGKGLFHAFAGICADLYFCLSPDRLWRLLDHIPNITR